MVNHYSMILPLQIGEVVYTCIRSLKFIFLKAIRDFSAYEIQQ